MLKLHRKELLPDFEARVKAFIQAKLDHQKTVDVPAPQEHYLVRAAVKRVPREGEPDDYATNYEIVEPTLEEKKKDLDHELHKARDAALHAKLSPSKRRLLWHHVSDAVAKQPEDHNEAERLILAKRDEIIKHDHKVERHAAKLHAQVEDLTEATVDSWKPEPFPSA